MEEINKTSMAQDESTKILNISDVSAYLKVGRKTALDFIKKNKIKFLKIGREYKIIKSSLIKFLEA